MTIEQFTASNTDSMRAFRNSYSRRNLKQNLFDWVDAYEAWKVTHGAK